MSVLDVVLAGILLVSALLGLWRGLVVEVMSLLSWLAAFWIALMFGADLAAWLGQWIESPTVRGIAAYVGSFIATLIVGGAVTWLIARIVKGTGLSGTDRLLGFLFGLTRGFAICALAVLLLGFTPLVQSPAWTESALVGWVQPGADWLRGWLPESLDAAPVMPAPGDASPSISSI